MPNTDKPLRDKDDFTNVCVRKSVIQEIKDYFDSLGEKYHLGNFFEKGATDRLHKLKIRNTPFDLISTDTFLKAGWTKVGSSTYKRGDSVAMYTGTFWYCDGVQLTRDNWYEKIGNKVKTKL